MLFGKGKSTTYRGLFTAGWFGVREKHCSQLEIYDRLRASEQAASVSSCAGTQFSIHLIGYVICAEFGACRLKHLVALGHRLYCARFGVHFQGAAQVLSRGGI